MHKSLFKVNGELSRLGQVEHYAHIMASLFGQLIDEGELADLHEIKREAQIVLDRFNELTAEEED